MRNTFTVSNIDMFSSRDAEDLHKEEVRLRTKLKKYAIDEFRRDIIVLRVVYDMTFEAIAEELHIPSVETAFSAFNKAIQYLKERKYRL